MQKREKILMTVALLAGTFFIVNQFLCTKREAAKPEPQKTTARAVKRQVPKPIRGEKISNDELERRLQNWQPLVTYETWGRDPFANALKFEPDSLQDSLILKLSGIVWKGNKAWVLIGDQILRPGERSGDFELLRVMKDRVVGRRNGDLVTLYLNREGTHAPQNLPANSR